MNTRLTLLCIVVTALPLGAQDPGLTPAWDIRKTLAALAEQTQRLQPVLEELKPREWIAKGAPAAYVDQWNQAKAETGYLVQNTQELSSNPEAMTATLNLFLRMQNLESTLNSLNEGVRRYDGLARAEVLRNVTSFRRTRRTGFGFAITWWSWCRTRKQS
jgi:hypothetical protein